MFITQSPSPTNLPLGLDAVGSGADTGSVSSGPASISGTHTATGGAKCVVFCFVFYTRAVTPATTVTYGGTSMTQWVDQEAGTATNTRRAQLFYLFNPPTGSQTVTVTPAAAAPQAMATVSYNGVTSISGFISGAATTTANSLSLTGVLSTDLVASFHAAAVSGAFTAYNRTQRFSGGNTASTPNRILIGDTGTPGLSGTVAMTATQPSTALWRAFGVRLIA